MNKCAPNTRSQDGCLPLLLAAIRAPYKRRRQQTAFYTTAPVEAEQNLTGSIDNVDDLTRDLSYMLGV